MAFKILRVAALAVSMLSSLPVNADCGDSRDASAGPGAHYHYTCESGPVTVTVSATFHTTDSVFGDAWQVYVDDCAGHDKSPLSGYNDHGDPHSYTGTTTVTDRWCFVMVCQNSISDCNWHIDSMTHNLMNGTQQRNETMMQEMITAKPKQTEKAEVAEPNACLDGGAACSPGPCCYSPNSTADCCCKSGFHCTVFSGDSCGVVACAPNTAVGEFETMMLEMIAAKPKQTEKTEVAEPNACLDGGAACSPGPCCYSPNSTADCCCKSGFHCTVFSGDSCGVVACAPNTAVGEFETMMLEMIAAKPKQTEQAKAAEPNACLDGGAACSPGPCCYSPNSTADCCCKSGFHCTVFSGDSCGVVACAPNTAVGEFETMMLEMIAAKPKHTDVVV